MAKKNSLKLVPYGVHREYVHPTGLRTYRALLEYTYGAPGEQTRQGYGPGGAEIEWVPNEPFTKTLRIDRLERGRSAARFWFEDEDGTQYPFFGQGLVEMLSAVTMENGVVTDTWIAVKRGANYGIERYVV